VFLPFQNHQRSIRWGKWKLNIFPQIDHREIFDLEKDPDEMRPLQGKDAIKSAAILDSMLSVARARYGDKTPLKIENPEPKEPVYENSKRRLDVWQPKWIRDKYFGGRTNPDHGPGVRKK
jgi:hypothetical protein